MISKDARAKTILCAISDAISDLLYYDRKEDDELPRGLIDLAIHEGDITVDAMVDQFRKQLTEGLMPLEQAKQEVEENS